MVLIDAPENVKICFTCQNGLLALGYCVFTKYYASSGTYNWADIELIQSGEPYELSTATNHQRYQSVIHW
jgi:hypothetical protein